MLTRANQLWDFFELCSAYYDIYVWGTLRDFGPCALRHASGHADNHIRSLGFELCDTSKLGEDFVFRLLPHGAGVEHDNIGILDAIGLDKAIFEQEVFDLIGVIHIHLAAPGDHGEALRARGCIGGCCWRCECVRHGLYFTVIHRPGGSEFGGEA